MDNTRNQLPPCQGLIGRIFGHALRPRVEYGQSPVSEFSGRGLSHRDIAGVLNAGREEIYIGDRCVRCGLFIANPYHESDSGGNQEASDAAR